MIEEVVDDGPEALLDRFGHLGVWDLDQVRGVAKSGLAQAVRFSRTYRFGTPIPARDVRRQLGSLPQGPMSIDAARFAGIYALGRSGA
jgi:hypothetical protein